MKKIRDSNIELLRVISMFLIVMHHTIIHGVYKNIDSYDFLFFKDHIFNFTLSNIFIAGGKVGVAIFILITGYFSINMNFSFKRILPLVYQTFFYSMLGLFIGILTHQNLSIKIIIKQFFPIIFSQYWFITCYVIILCLAPFIVLLLKNLDSKMNLYLFSILLAVNIVFPTILPGSFAIVTNSFFTLLLFFITGYYLNFYKNNFNLSIKTGSIIVSTSTALYLLSIFMIEFLSILTKSKIFHHAYRLSNLNSILVFAFSVGLFIIFKSINIKNRISINKVATLTLGIYLIHDNFFMRSIIWGDIFKLYNSLEYASEKFIILILFSSILVFIICMIIEFIRQTVVNYIKKIRHKKAHLN